jgi:hypothetical protein
MNGDKKIDDKKNDPNKDKKLNKNPIIKLPANDEAWGAPTAPRPVIKLLDKVDRYLQQRTQHEL